MVDKRNYGKQNELKILDAIDGKSLYELPDHFEKGITQMYKFVSKGDVVKATKYSDWDGNKPDIKIELSNHDKYMNVSIKSGWMPSLHQEYFNSFIQFLRTLEISEETISTVIFYHHADGTYDGTGVNKLRFDEFREKHKERIAKASEELSQEHIVKAIAYRALVVGRYEGRMKVNWFYHGTEEEGIFIHRDTLIENICSVGREKYTALHFGPIVYVAKIPSKVNEYGKKYHYAQLIWPKMDEDFKEIYEKTQKCNVESKSIYDKTQTCNITSKTTNEKTQKYNAEFEEETYFEKLKKWWKEFVKKYLS